MVVLKGKDRGKEGVVMRAMPKEGKVIVDGVNIARKHQKARKATMQGGIINKDMPIEVSTWRSSAPTAGPPASGSRSTRTARRCASIGVQG